MTSPRMAFLRHLLLAACTVLAPANAGATWVTDGNAVCQAAGDQFAIAAAPDGSGGMFVVWRDTRRGPSLFDLYGTHVLADGTIAAGWPTNGLLLAETGKVCAGPSGFVGTLHAIGDGTGGLIALWYDGSTFKAHMQHVGGDGALAAGFPANGVQLPLSIGSPAGYHIRAASDGSGGAYILSNRTTAPGDENAYVTRVTGAGLLAWSAGGVWVGGTTIAISPYFWHLSLATDPAGGVLAEVIVAQQSPAGNRSYVTRLLPNSATGFSATLSGPSVMSSVSDGSGGAFVTWPNSMQHYLANGSASWPNPTPAPAFEATYSDGAGGFYLLGPVPGNRLELHRRAGDASTPAGWSTGHVLTSTGSLAPFASVLSGTSSFVSWLSSAPWGHNILASVVQADGALAPGWADGGTVVCGANGERMLGAMVEGTNYDAFLAWTDQRPGTNGVDVYVSHLQGPIPVGVPRNGPAPGALAVERIAPNPAGETAELTFVLPRAESALVELVDVAGRTVGRVDAQTNAGRQRVTLATSRLANGVYFARVRQGGASVRMRFSVIH